MTLVYLFFMFVLHVLALGIYIAKLGEKQEQSYSLVGMCCGVS
jgi:hypothetical protein